MPNIVLYCKGCPVYGVQNARAYNSDKRFFKLSLDVILKLLLERCTGFFFNRTLSAIFCEHGFPKKKIEGTKYSISLLSIYYCSGFLRDVFL